MNNKVEMIACSNDTIYKAIEGEIIYFTTASCKYLLEKGCLKVFSLLETSQEKIHTELTENAIFDESIFTDKYVMVNSDFVIIRRIK